MSNSFYFSFHKVLYTNQLIDPIHPQVSEGIIYGAHIIIVIEEL